MRETSKTVAIWSPTERARVAGHGIDIGAGDDPLPMATIHFDMADGDANLLESHPSAPFDFVYSSHCLEHMHDPLTTARRWCRLLRPGGHLVVIVPDEDLYEQGIWPSIHNSDHKHTFTISKASSWSPMSINILDLARALPDMELIDVRLQDHGYDRRLLSFGRGRASLPVRAIGKLAQHGLFPRRIAGWLHRRSRGVIDQTLMQGRLAQIQLTMMRR